MLVCYLGSHANDERYLNIKMFTSARKNNIHRYLDRPMKTIYGKQYIHVRQKDQTNQG